MARRMMVSRPYRGKVDRKTEWIASADITAVTSLASQAAILDQTLIIASFPQLIGATVVRTRGSWWVDTDQVSGTESYLAAMGMAIVSAQAAAIGVTAVPTPITDEFSDLFFVYDVLGGRFNFGTAASFAQTGVTKEFDSKAQRKVSEDETLIVTLENSFSVGLNYWLKFRLLFKLP